MRVFDEETRRRIEALAAGLRRRARGEYGSGARAPRGSGRSEFRDHRPYALGDDFRAIDWTIYGRLGELFVKRFEGEAEYRLELILDRSGSMAAGSPSKDVLARRLVAASALALAGEGRSARIHELGATGLRSSELVLGLSGAPALYAWLEGLDAPKDALSWEPLLPLLRERSRARSLVVCSDFFGDEEGLSRLLGPRPQRCELRLLSLLAPEERRPSFRGALSVLGMEGQGRLRLHADEALLGRYAELLATQRAELRRRSAAAAACLREVESSDALERAFATLWSET